MAWGFLIIAVALAAPAHAADQAGGGGIDWTLVIGISTLEMAVISCAVGVVWKLSRSEISMRAEATSKFNALQIETEHRIGEMRVEAERRIAAIQGEAASATAALSEKLYKVEIWSRDEFVRKGSFEIVTARLEKAFADFRGEVTGRLDKMTDRIEHIRADA